MIIHAIYWPSSCAPACPLKTSKKRSKRPLGSPDPRLLSDNGPCYVSKALKEYLEQEGIAHTRGRPYHPMTQSKIERCHRSMKNILLLENYYSSNELIDQIGLFVDHYNNSRYHEALNNLTPADVYYGKGREILTRRERIKKNTMIRRRRYNCSLKVA